MNEIPNRLAALVSEVETDVWHFSALSQEEQIAVAVVLARLDLLLQRGIHSIDAAKDRLGRDWWRAVQAVQRSRRGRAK